MKSGRWRRPKDSEHRLFTLKVAWALSVGLVGEAEKVWPTSRGSATGWTGWRVVL